MDTIRVKLDYDPTGRNPNNLISGEKHVLVTTPGIPYKIFTLNDGGFYTNSLKVFDKNLNLLVVNKDYIVTYVFDRVSKLTGLKVCAAIVMLDKAATGNVFVSAQMVGGDVAFSLTVVTDYVEFYNKQVAGYVPESFDYAGNEPVWGPGELDKERWKLDTYQPFNNEIYYLSRAISGAVGDNEEEFRAYVRDAYDRFTGKFDTDLDKHIADLNNPHKDNKAQLGLGDIVNNKLATEAQARAATANDLYLTPALSYSIVDELAMKPLNAHVTDYNNPHRITAAQLGTMSKTEIKAKADTKYERTDPVVNSTTLYGTTGTVVRSIRLSGYCIPVNNIRYGTVYATNDFYYEFINNTTVKVEKGDTLVYTMKMQGADLRGGIDFKVIGGKYATMRLYTDEGVKIVDQNGYNAHPGIKIPAAANKWYSRIIPLDVFAGLSITGFAAALEGDNVGICVIDLNQVFVKNRAGAIKATIFNGSLAIPNIVGAEGMAGDSGSYSALKKITYKAIMPPNTTGGRSYQDIENDVTYNLTGSNFTSGGLSGYLPSARLGSGTVGSRTALRSDSQWVDWTTVMNSYGYVKKPSVMAMSFANVSLATARTIATDQTWADEAEPGSTIVMSLYDSGTDSDTTNAVVKTDDGWKDL